MIVFVINPISGNGKSLQVWKRIEPLLAKRGVAYRAVRTAYAGHGTELARQAVEELGDTLQAVVAVGGDGTIHEVVNGVAEYPDVPVALIPSGSGNDFSRGFGGEREPEVVLERLLGHLLKREWAETASVSAANAKEGVESAVAVGEQVPAYDLGRYELLGSGKRGFFINAIGIGFDGEVARVTNQAWYKPFLNRLRLGALAYVVTVLRLLFTYQTHRVTLVVDGETQTYERVWLLAVSNIPYYGGGMKISPDAKPDDGEYHLCVVHGLSRLKLLLLFGTVFQGKHVRLPEVTVRTGRAVEVQSDRPMTIHGDGEILGTTPVGIELVAGGRRIL
ncbi:MAG TPA: diacylglycerol kinase family protein [Bacilli bacterium]|nr:diacylglycerol kinase family protein [Bacilli bacterium]